MSHQFTTNLDDILYFDYMATTPCAEVAQLALQNHLGRQAVFANPGSNHRLGWQSRQHLAQASMTFANCIGAPAESIIWTSGATESNDLAIMGAVGQYAAQKGQHIISCATEHKAVLAPCQYLARHAGYRLTLLQPAASGLLDAQQVADACQQDTVLASVMLVNNETGVIQDINAIAAAVHSCGALLHVDGAQALGKIPIDVTHLNADLISFSGHKCYAPPGIGALYIRQKPRLHLQPRLIGGGQQYGIRAGTLPLALISAMAAATAWATQDLEQEHKRITSLQQRLWQGIQSMTKVELNGDLEQRVPHNLNFHIPGMHGQALLYALNQKLALSSGSACNAATIQPSHVLQAMGQSHSRASNAIRFSLGRTTTEHEIEQALAWIEAQLTRLKGMAF